MGVKSVAIYSEADRCSNHVNLADQAICVGAGSNSDSYLNLANVLMAVQISGADAVHPGYGYFSERTHFATALQGMGVKFIGPPVSAIEAMGDKAKAKAFAIKAKCPVVPGSPGAVLNEADAIKYASEIGYPVLLKAVAGGGGRGIRRATSADEIQKLYSMASAEAQASFGNGELLIEKSLVKPRHVEIQILGDEYGRMVYLGERECSVQNLRHQKLIEESPDANLSPKTRKSMGESAVRVASSVKYTNAGTVEFLVDADEKYYFLEMNTRLQVEHPVTEEVTGYDIVRWMLKIASGEHLTIAQRDVHLQGHAIEARITAQDPEKDFAPITGSITGWCPPTGPGIRIESHCHAGYEVSPFYDPLLAKLIVKATSRHDAVTRLQAALHDFKVAGIATNISFLSRLCHTDEFISGKMDTQFVGRFLDEAID